MRLFGFYIVVASLLVSCEYFKQESQEGVVARVNDEYLYISDIQKLISENTTPEDSTLIVNNYITRWATQKLLIGQAKINLTNDKLDRFNELVEEYKNDLLTDAYKNVIVGQQLDSTVNELEFGSYYEENKENFKLADAILKVRFLQLPVNYEGLASVKEKFIRYNQKDKEALSGRNFQFVSSNLNDSVWIKINSFQFPLARLPGGKGKNSSRCTHTAKNSGSIYNSGYCISCMNGSAMRR